MIREERRGEEEREGDGVEWIGKGVRGVLIMRERREGMEVRKGEERWAAINIESLRKNRKGSERECVCVCVCVCV